MLNKATRCWILERLKKTPFGCLEKPLSNLCRRYTMLVVDYPYICIIIPVLVTVALTPGFVYRIQNAGDKEVDELYVPVNARSKVEKTIVEQLFPPVDGAYVPSRTTNERGQVVVIATAQDGGSILRPTYRESLIKFNDYVLQNISITNNSRSFTYKDLCVKFSQRCYDNRILKILDSSLIEESTFPMAKRGSRYFYLGNVLGGVTIDDISGQIVDVKAWLLIYQMTDNKTHYPLVKRMLREMEKRFLEYDDDIIDIAFFHSETLTAEIKRNTTSNHLRLRFFGGLLLLLILVIIFSLETSRRDDKFTYVDWTRSKVTVATTGLVGALMGIVSSVGLLTYLGYPYCNAVDVMPFLVIGVRLDNTFLMLSAVQQTDRRHTLRHRLQQAMGESAVSITITVLTDILSFGVGLATDFLAVQIFSVYILVAISITFVYQLTFLLGILVLSIRSEERNLHNVFPWKLTIDANALETKHVSIIQQFCCLGSHSRTNKAKAQSTITVIDSTVSTPNHTDNQLDETITNKTIRLYYAPFLMRFEVKIVACILYALYLGAAVYGCTITQLGLEPIKLLVEDSYTIKYYQAMEEYYWRVGSQAQIVFSNAGDMSDARNRQRILEIVDEFSNTPHGMGPENVDFWLNSLNRMLDYDKASNSNSNFYSDLDFFLSIEEHAQYRNDIHWDNSTHDRKITAFRAMVSLKNISTSIDQMAAADELRSLAAKYPEFDISTFHVLWRYVDQYQAVLPNTIQEVCSGVGFMILVALFFIPSAACSLWVILAILSIDAGIVGFMTFWGINLDTISMMTIVMSIGFSVDFTTHIAHGYVVVQAKDDNERMAKVLCSLVKPISEGALATIVGVIVLVGTNSYMTSAFFRTVLLVVVIGFIHAVIFLPVALSTLSGRWTSGDT